MRLRSLARAGNALLAALALFVCAAFVVLTTMMDQVSTEARTASETMRAADLVRIDLLAYGRASDVAYLSRTPQAEAARSRLEGALVGHLHDARSKARAGEHHDLLVEGEARVNDYLAIRRDAELRGGAAQDVLMTATPALTSALETMDRLATVDLNAVMAADEKVHGWNRIANTVGAVSAVLMLVGFAAVSLGVNRLVVEPLLALSAAIEQFASGARDARVSPRGTAEFRRVAENFNEMARRLQEQHQDLLTFLAGVAHDLRNPLAALRMSAQYLAADRALPPEPAVRHTMALVDRQVSRLERMVGDFLDACRIEGGHIELVTRRQDLRDIARDTVDLYELSSSTHRLTLHTPDDGIVVDCDGERIAQVLNNLVSNAIKYSPNGGGVKISVARAEDGGSIVVSDEGVGIAASDIPHVFEPFRRTAASRETVPGVGLGLSVSRRIVEAHGGRIEVESKLGIGTTFRVYLPKTPPRVAPAGSPIGAEPLPVPS